MSISRLNSHAACPFQRWVNRLEGLEMSPSGVARKGENGWVALTFDLRPVRHSFQRRLNLSVCGFNGVATCPFAV